MVGKALRKDYGRDGGDWEVLRVEVWRAGDGLLLAEEGGRAENEIANQPGVDENCGGTVGQGEGVVVEAGEEDGRRRGGG